MSSFKRPVIGLTTQTLHSIDGIPPGLPSSWVMNQRYFLAATMVGAVPWMIPLLDDDLLTLLISFSDALHVNTVRDFFQLTEIGCHLVYPCIICPDRVT